MSNVISLMRWTRPDTELPDGWDERRTHVHGRLLRVYVILGEYGAVLHNPETDRAITIPIDTNGRDKPENLTQACEIALESAFQHITDQR